MKVTPQRLVKLAWELDLSVVSVGSESISKNFITEVSMLAQEQGINYNRKTTANDKLVMFK